MDSPLKYDKGIVKEFKITQDVDSESQTGFVRSQLDQIKSALYRERVELIISQAQVDLAEDPIIKNQHQGKLDEHRLLIKQFVRSIDVLSVLLNELEATN